jgi:hypothetical protein
MKAPSKVAKLVVPLKMLMISNTLHVEDTGKIDQEVGQGANGSQFLKSFIT